MNDTSPQMAQKVEELMEQKSPEERLRMGWSMHQASKYLVACAIRSESPNISQSELKKEIFLRFYGNDFSAAEKEKILEHLGKIHE